MGYSHIDESRVYLQADAVVDIEWFSVLLWVSFLLQSFRVLRISRPIAGVSSLCDGCSPEPAYMASGSEVTHHTRGSDIPHMWKDDETSAERLMSPAYYASRLI